MIPSEGIGAHLNDGHRHLEHLAGRRRKLASADERPERLCRVAALKMKPAEVEVANLSGEECETRLGVVSLEPGADDEQSTREGLQECLERREVGGDGRQSGQESGAPGCSL
jgi:hypothetical protein